MSDLKNNEVEVSLVPCPNYDFTTLYTSLENLLTPIGGLDFVKAGMTIGIKANLVSALSPQKAATTHPALICALAKMLKLRGANVIIGDSPGGLYNNAHLSKIYETTQMSTALEYGAMLNYNFATKDAEFLNATVLKSFKYTAWFDECDAIINVCKLKTHGMMGMSAATKNMFGAIPGTIKLEYHYRFPNLEDFSKMMVDINEYFTPKLCIVDAIQGMEGNGPTKGTPRDIGLILASKEPYKLDLICADIIGLKKDEVPTLQAAFECGFIPEKAEYVKVLADYKNLKMQNFQNVAVKNSMLFDKNSKFKKMILRNILHSKPKLKARECIGCQKCANICPAKAIVMKNKKAVIDSSLCIRCFCCQEFCPVGAMKVYRTPIARILSK